MIETAGSNPAHDETVLTTQAASEFLQEHLPRENGVSYWFHFLANNRRRDRPTQVAIPFSRWGKKLAVYHPADLMRYVELERSRQLGNIRLPTRAVEALKAFGVGDPGGSSTGRKLECRVSPQLDETTDAAGSMFVRMVISKPLLVYRLSVDEARSLMHELAEALEVCERVIGPPRSADKVSA